MFQTIRRFPQVRGLDEQIQHMVATQTKDGNDVPLGAILAWGGTEATMPTGYINCDGTRDTPDLRTAIAGILFMKRIA